MLLAKKPGGGVRVCIDYRQLNKVTKKRKYPLPLIDETIALLRKGKFVSKIDMQKAFNRLRMEVSSEDLTTFMCRYGSYKYRVMPFGLCNGPADYQRFVNDHFMDFLGDFLQIYLDDFWITSDSEEDHLRHLSLIFERLREIGLHADINKSEFFVNEVKFLGLIITNDGVKMDPKRVQAILTWPTPKTTRGIRSFLGFVGYHRRFISNFSKIAKPLNNLLKKDAAPWDVSCDQAFEAIKAAVAKEPVMRHLDLKAQIFIEYDASDSAVGGVMS